MSSFECRVSSFGFISLVFFYALFEHVPHTRAEKWHVSRACDDNREVSGACSSNLYVNHMRGVHPRLQVSIGCDLNTCASSGKHAAVAQRRKGGHSASSYRYLNPTRHGLFGSIRGGIAKGGSRHPSTPGRHIISIHPSSCGCRVPGLPRFFGSSSFRQGWGLSDAG